MKKLLLGLLVGLGLTAGVAYAAPLFNYSRTIIPESNTTYDLGSSSPTRLWNNVFTNNLLVNSQAGTGGCAYFDGSGYLLGGATCSGGGGGSGGGWSTSSPNIISTNWLSTTNALVGINSSTPWAVLTVKGISGTTTPTFVVASSTNAMLLRVASNGSTTLSTLGTGPVYSVSGSLYNAGATGTGLVVQQTSPTLVTPILGVASGTALTLSNNLWVDGTARITGTSTLATTSIPALSNLTSNGFVKTSGGNGLLTIDTTTYSTLTASGTPGDIQFYGSSSALDADGNFNWDNAGKQLNLGSGADIVYIQGNTGGAGTQIVIAGGNGDASSVGGLLNLTSGYNANNTSGNAAINLAGGLANGTGAGITINAGTGKAANGGALSLTSGSVSTGDGAGGALNITSGNGNGTGNAGTILITSGDGGSTSGNAGNIVLNTGQASNGLHGVLLVSTTTPTTSSVFIQGNTNKHALTIASSTGVTLFQVGVNGSTTIANLTASACDVKSTTGGSLYCGVDATGAGGGITQLNGLTADPQSFAVATSGGLSLLISSVTDTHTFTLAPYTGYSIPLTASTTEWATAYGWGDHAGLYPTFAYASSSYVHLWNLTAGSNITITTSSVPTIAVSSTPTFTTLSTGQGQYELYAMDQDVLTSSNVTFAKGIFTNASTTGFTASGNLYFPGLSNGCLQVSSGVATSTGVNCGSGSGNSAWTLGSGLIYNATSTDSVLIGTSTPTTSTLFVQGSGSKHPLTVASSTGTTLFQITATSQILACTTCRLTIPQGTAPTLSAAGDIAVDTSNGGMFSFYANGRENVVATSSKAVYIESPTASEDIILYRADQPTTITKVTCSIRSTVSNTPSWTFSLPHDTSVAAAGANAMTTGQACTATTSPSTITIGGDITLAAGEVLRATSSAVSNASSTFIQLELKFDN